MLKDVVYLRLVQPATEYDQMVKGDAIICTREVQEKKQPAGSKTLIICCPQCGFTAYHEPHNYNEETKTLTPSLKCLNCDFHGYLDNGVFINAKN